MNNLLKYGSAFLIAVAIILAFVFFTYFDYGKNLGELEKTATSTIGTGGEILEGVVLEDIPVEGAKDIPRPELNRVIPEFSLNPEAKANLINLLEEVIGRIEEKPYSFDDWIDLGVLRLELRDYEGAKEAWEYHALLYPNNALSFNNLGDLYHYYLKDYPLSERNFLKAIQNDPASPTQYRSLHDLYRLSYLRETTKAVDILKKGLDVNPEAIDLTIALASYYKDRKDFANAKIYYGKAIDQAKLMKNDTLLKQLQEELDNIK